MPKLWALLLAISVTVTLIAQSTAMVDVVPNPAFEGARELALSLIIWA